MWNRKSATIGPLKPGQQAKVLYKFEGDTIELIPGTSGKGYQMETSCGCTSASWDSGTRTMSLNFVAREIPHHLKEKGEYSTSQFVTFPAIIDGIHTEETLSFKAVIKQFG